ncbi:unnamed protein product [Lactuca virosa]|uniref:Uncharacterized protein n=1 Tax=Lactuca virosa TaxID=75947 RepID=A0AAU9LRR1_9ASTR|nr:unnamed protein product [Lactuca virosa]
MKHEESVLVLKNMVDSATESALLETVKHQNKSDKINIVDKFVIQEKPHNLTKDEEDDDHDGNIPIPYKKATYGSDFSRNESGGWVELDRSLTDKQVSVHNSETKKSNDWHDVVDIEMALHLGIIVSDLLSPP